MESVQGQLRSEALHRIGNIHKVLSDPNHKLYKTVSKIRKNWLGTEKEANVITNLGVLHNQLKRMPIDVSQTTQSYLGMVAGRPPGNNRYPGYAQPGVDQAPMPPGMSLNSKYMPEAPTIDQRYKSDSPFTKRTWTVVHEASHGILGTHDYRVYNWKNRGMTRKTYLDRPTATKFNPENPAAKYGYTEGPRKLGATQKWQDAKRDNADSWAGFVMNASQHINHASATRIQAAFRGKLARRAAENIRQNNASVKN